MMTRRQLLAASSVTLALSTTSLVSRAAEQLRLKTAHILTGFAPGSVVDAMARLVAGEMKNYALSFIVEPRPGASGRTAVEAVKAAEPDGSVILFAPLGFIVLFPHIYRTLRYKPQDFTPVSTVASSPTLLTVGPKVPGGVRTLADFILWCRADPKRSTYGTAGIGTSLHFIGATLARTVGFEFLHVPYQGGAMIHDLLAGEIAATLLPIDSTLGFIQSGNLRALATTGPTRSTFLPDVPTMTEAGYPSLKDLTRFGFFVPAKTPTNVVEKLNNAIHEALDTDDVKSGMAKLSMEIDTISMTDFARLIASESERWGATVRATGFTLID